MVPTDSAADIPENPVSVPTLAVDAVPSQIEPSQERAEQGERLNTSDSRSAETKSASGAQAATAAVLAVASRMKDEGARKFWSDNGLPFSVPWSTFKMLFEMNFFDNRQMSEALTAHVKKEIDLDGDGNIITAEFDRFCQQHPLSSIRAWLLGLGLDENEKHTTEI